MRSNYGNNNPNSILKCVLENQRLLQMWRSQCRTVFVIFKISRHRQQPLENMNLDCINAAALLGRADTLRRHTSRSAPSGHCLIHPFYYKFEIGPALASESVPGAILDISLLCYQAKFPYQLLGEACHSCGSNVQPSGLGAHSCNGYVQPPMGGCTYPLQLCAPSPLGCTLLPQLWQAFPSSW